MALSTSTTVYQWNTSSSGNDLPSDCIALVSPATRSQWTSLFLLIFLPLVIVPSLILLIRLVKKLVVVSCFQRFSPGVLEALDKFTQFIDDFQIFLSASLFGTLWDLFQIFITVFACVLFVVELYITRNENCFAYPAWIFWLELIFSVCFGIDHIMHFVASRDKLRYYLSWHSLIDIFTYLPFLVSVIVNSVSYGNSIIRPLRLLRVLRILKTYKVLEISAGIQRRIFAVVFTLIALLLVTATVVMFIEDSPSRPLPFHLALYFLVVTFSTVGYGDIQPQTEFGRMAVMVIIPLAFFLLSYQSARLINALTTENTYFRRIHGNPNESHVVVMGHITTHGIIYFLREFFHKQHPLSSYKVIIFHSEEPSFHMRSAVLHNPYYSDRVKYFQGNPMVYRDMDRVSLNSAKACFVLTDKRRIDKQAVDAETLLQCLKVKDYHPRLKLCAQIHEQRTMLELIDAQVDHVVCIERLKMGLMARNCITPGFSTLMTNLCRTYTVEKPGSFGSNWLEEYNMGCANQIYQFRMPASYIGERYEEIALAVFQQFNATLIGCTIDDEIVLMPCGQTILKDSYGFVISATKNVDDITIKAWGGITRYESRLSKDDNNFYSSDFFVARRQDSSTNLSRIEKGNGKSRAKTEQDLGKSVPLNKLEDHPDHKNSYCFHDANTYCPQENVLASLWDSSTEPSYWTENFFIEAVATDLSRVSYNYATLSSLPDFSDHIIFFGEMTTELVHFILPLRFRLIRQQRPVIFVHSTAPNPDVWAVVGRFPAVYAVMGNPFHCLGSLKVERAAATVISFRNEFIRQSGNKSGPKSQEISDALTLMTLRSLCRQYSQDCYFITEFEKDSNILFVYSNKSRSPFRNGDDKRINESGFISSAFSKNSKSSSLFESIFRFLPIGGQSTGASLKFPEYHFTPGFSSGTAITYSFFDSLAAQSYHNRHLIQIMEILICGSSPHHSHAPHVFQIPISDSFEGRTYGELFEHLLVSHLLLAIGLFRSSTESVRQYVYTNPASSVTVGASDHVFVLTLGMEPSPKLMDNL